MSIKLKLIILFVALSSVPMFFVGYLSLANYEKALTDEALSKLDVVSSLQKERVEHFIDHNFERIGSLQSRVQLRVELSKYLKDKNSKSLASMNSIVLAALPEMKFARKIFIIDLDGIVATSTDTGAIGLESPSLEAFAKGKVGKDTSVFGKNTTGESILYVSGPLNIDGELVGVVVIESSLEQLTGIFKSYAGLGDTGEILLAKKDSNGDALIITPLRFDPDASLTRVVPGSDNTKPIIRALNGGKGPFADTVNYRGVSVFSSTKYIGSVGWGLSANIDKAEILAPVIDLKSSILSLLAIVTIFCTILAIIIAKDISDPILYLVTVASSIEKKGFDVDLMIRTVSQDDEIGILSNTLKKMADSLRGIYSTLEEKVSLRTMELQSTKVKLEEKLKDVEKLNGFMVDRELRISALKKEIEILKGKNS